jgi:porphobilinogen deaminase
MAPVGAIGRIEADQLQLQAAVLSTDGRQRVFASGAVGMEYAELLGTRVAQWLIEQGAAELIAEGRKG